MRSVPSKLKSLALTVVLFIWVVGVFHIPHRTWLQPFAQRSGNSLVETMTVPGAEERPGRRRLATIEIDREKSYLLTIGAASGGAFSLQIRDNQNREVLGVFRFPARVERKNDVVVLDAGRWPTSLRLTLWNRNRSKLEIESAVLSELGAGYRWPRRLYLALGPVMLLWFGVRYRAAWIEYFRSGDRGAATEDHRRWDGLIAALIFLVCFSVFRIAPVHQVLDSKFITAVSHSLIRTGSVALPADFGPSRRARQIYTLRPVGEKTYHFFSSAPAVLNAPIVAVFEAAGVSSVAPDGRFLGHHEVRILRFIAAFTAALLCAVLFLTARIWLPPGYSVVLVLVFAFGTQIFSTLSRPFWSHSWSTLLLATALFLLVSPRFKDLAGSYVAVSTLVCWAYFCRPPLSLAIVGIGFYLLLKRRRYLLPFVVTGLLWAGLFGLYSAGTYGSLVPPYFLSAHLKSGRLAGGLLLTSYPRAMMGSLFSPGRGLFVYLPFIVLVLFTVVRRWRWLPEKGLAVTALAVSIANWQLVSMFRNWSGGQSFGPRLLSDMLPWLFLLAVLALAAVRVAATEGQFRWTPAKLATIGLVVAASIFINTRGATAQETQRGAGIWNWRYPQFMAGLLPRPDSPQE